MNNKAIDGVVAPPHHHHPAQNADMDDAIHGQRMTIERYTANITCTDHENNLHHDCKLYRRAKCHGTICVAAVALVVVLITIAVGVVVVAGGRN